MGREGLLQMPGAREASECRIWGALTSHSGGLRPPWRVDADGITPVAWNPLVS